MDGESGEREEWVEVSLKRETGSRSESESLFQR